VEEAMNDKKPAGFDYKTHILIGCTSDGKMTVICRWPHVPQQAEVEQVMRMSKEGHSTFLLCTPTSILPVNADGQREQQSSARPK
jgi:hypothetical protein